MLRPAGTCTSDSVEASIAPFDAPQFITRAVPRIPAIEPPFFGCGRVALTLWKQP